jgi:hypothetical protein
LFFKKNEELVLSEKEERKLIKKIMNVNIGIAQIIQVDLMGIFIQVNIDLD